MKKEQLLEILESCLLNFEGRTEQELKLSYGLNPQNIQIGCKLNNFLQEKVK